MVLFIKKKYYPQGNDPTYKLYVHDFRAIKKVMTEIGDAATRLQKLRILTVSKMFCQEQTCTSDPALSEDTHNASVYVGAIKKMMGMVGNISSRKVTFKNLFSEDTEI